MWFPSVGEKSPTPLSELPACHVLASWDASLAWAHSHQTTQLFAEGFSASLGVDPRRRTHAVGIYTQVLDQHGIAYNQPIVLNERQAGAAIEGVIRQGEKRDDGGLLRLSVDTHGYTNVGMALSKMLGFDLCPRLRDLSERKLYLPRGWMAPEGVAPVVCQDISLKAIRDGWDGLLRLAASIKSGRLSAIVALERFRQRGTR